MLASLIRRVPLFSTLPPAEIEALGDSLKEAHFPVSTVLFREGDSGDRFFIVADGKIAIIKAIGTEAERILGYRGAGEFIGEMSLLIPEGLRTASARVEQDSRLLVMTRDDFNRLLHRQPSIAYEMLRVLSSRLQHAHDESLRDLKKKNRQLTEAYEHLKAAQAQIIEKEILERELRQAREIQESMLPRVLPRPDRFDLGARMVPARQVGGDFFDVIPLKAGAFGIVIGDVSGKGVPAALFMALTRSLLRAEASRNATPTEVLKHVNRHLMDMNEKGMFVTILYGVLQPVSGCFDFVRAGHEIPILLETGGKALLVEAGRGQLVGLFPSPVLEEQTLYLPPGGTLLLYTDGATEAKNASEDFFGLERLLSTVTSSQCDSAQALCDHVVQVLTDYHGEAPQADDITVLAVRAQAATSP